MNRPEWNTFNVDEQKQNARVQIHEATGWGKIFFEGWEVYVFDWRIMVGFEKIMSTIYDWELIQV